MAELKRPRGLGLQIFLHNSPQIMASFQVEKPLIFFPIWTDIYQPLWHKSFLTLFVKRWGNLPSLTVWKYRIHSVYFHGTAAIIFSKQKKHIMLGPKTPPIYIIHSWERSHHIPWKVSFWVHDFPNFPTQVGYVFSFPGGNHRPMVTGSGHTDPVCPRYEMPSSYQPDPPKNFVEDSLWWEEWKMEMVQWR